MRHLATGGPTRTATRPRAASRSSPPPTRYRYKNFEAFLSVENLTNTDWREAQFFFTSRLAGEPAAGVNDIHYTPGNPRSFLGGIAWHF